MWAGGNLRWVRLRGPGRASRGSLAKDGGKLKDKRRFPGNFAGRLRPRSIHGEETFAGVARGGRIPQGRRSGGPPSHARRRLPQDGNYREVGDGTSAHLCPLCKGRSSRAASRRGRQHGVHRVYAPGECYPRNGIDYPRNSQNCPRNYCFCPRNYPRNQFHHSRNGCVGNAKGSGCFGTQSNAHARRTRERAWNDSRRGQIPRQPVEEEGWTSP